jgi:hypothetical protein
MTLDMIVLYFFTTNPINMQNKANNMKLLAFYISIPLVTIDIAKKRLKPNKTTEHCTRFHLLLQMTQRKWCMSCSENTQT